MNMGNATLNLIMLLFFMIFKKTKAFDEYSIAVPIVIYTVITVVSIRCNA